jgi:ribose 1,5-bisphosphate isomerase
VASPIVVAAGIIKIHQDTLTGAAVETGHRDEREVLSGEDRTEIGDVEVLNPAFDVTPARHVDVIVTERGSSRPRASSR